MAHCAKPGSFRIAWGHMQLNLSISKGGDSTAVLGTGSIDGQPLMEPVELALVFLRYVAMSYYCGHPGEVSPFSFHLLTDGSKVTPSPSLHKSESRQLFQHLLVCMCSEVPVIMLALCWACSSFSLLYQGAHSCTQQIRGNLVNVKWKKITVCAHVTQNRSLVCGKGRETLVAMIRAR